MQLIQIKRNQYYEQFVHLYQSSFPTEEQNPLSVMFMYRNNINSFLCHLSIMNYVYSKLK